MEYKLFIQFYKIFTMLVYDVFKNIF
jgi:hypothetical protein